MKLDPLMSISLKDRCCDLLEDLELATRDEVTNVVPLTGGVASDIARIDTLDRTYCAKFALAKLRVAADWHAPVHRNAAEYAWLEFVHDLRPESAPCLFGRSQAENGFVMEFLSGDNIRLWKSDLLQNGPRSGDAERVAKALVDIHSSSTTPGFNKASFQNQRDFYALRLEPYLDSLKSKHPDLSTQFQNLIETYNRHAVALVHGDISPKNILLRAGEPVFLDAECATMGDPSFDVAFCLNHLLLKAVHLPQYQARFLTALRTFWVTYQEGITWEAANEMEARTARLLPALFLARVDGKSPVEYLNGAARTKVREAARALLSQPENSLTALLEIVESRLL